MKYARHGVALLSALAFSTASFGFEFSDGGYYSVNYTDLEYAIDSTNIDDNASPKAITGAFGKHFHPLLAAEVRWGIGLGDDRLDDDTKVDVDHMIGLYLRATSGFKSDDRLEMYAIMGYSNVTFSGTDQSQSGFTTSVHSENGMGVGVGVGCKFNENTSFNIEYNNFFRDTEGDVKTNLTGISLGIQSGF